MTLVAAKGAYSTLFSVAILLAWGSAHLAAFVVCQVRVMTAGAPSSAFAGSLNISSANIGIAAGIWLGGVVLERAGVAWIGLAASILCACAGLLAMRIQVTERPEMGKAA